MKKTGALVIAVASLASVSLAIAPGASAHGIPRSKYKPLSYAEFYGPYTLATWGQSHHRKIIPVAPGGILVEAKCYGVGRGFHHRYAHFNCTAVMYDGNAIHGSTVPKRYFSFRLHIVPNGFGLATNVAQL